MFSEPSSAAVAGVQAVMVALPLLGLGYLIVDLFLGTRLGRIVCLGLAVPGLMLFSLALMLVHIATGGAIFSNLVLVRAITLLLLAVLIGRRVVRGKRAPVDSERGHLWLPLVAVAIGFLLWCIPIFVITPLNFGVDIRLHMGWASQLFNGETTPTSGITGDIPNGYPWLFHALTALVSALTPGTRTFTAQAPVQIIQLAGITVALFALGMELTKNVRGAWGAAIFGAYTGGFGWLIARGPAIVTDTRGNAFDYAGDLIPRRSPNMAFHDLVPVYPRDIGFVLVICIALTLLAGIRRRNLIPYVVGGVVLGMAGLTGGEAFIAGGVIAVAMSLLPGPGSPWKRLLAAFAPGAAVAALWYLPLVITYLRLGGFVDSAYPPVELPALGYLGAFGVTVPFALYGLWLARSRRGTRVAVAAILLGVPIFLLLLAGQLPKVLGDGFSTLGRQHRYWPLFYLGLVTWAAIGFDGALQLLGSGKRRWAPILVVGTLLFAVPSPLLASIGATRRLEPPVAFTEAVTGDPNNLLNVIAPQVGMGCTLAVPRHLSVATFAYTGYRQVIHDLTGRSPNRARVRWRDIYKHVPDDLQRARDNAVLTTGVAPKRWESIADDYEVDMVVARADDASAPAFIPYQKERAEFGSRSWVVIRRRSC